MTKETARRVAHALRAVFVLFSGLSDYGRASETLQLSLRADELATILVNDASEQALLVLVVELAYVRLALLREQVRGARNVDRAENWRIEIRLFGHFGLFAT